jgi:hypothetical protein
VEPHIEQLAWVVLRAANRAQAKGSTARLAVPRAPEVAEEMGVELTDEQYLSVEDYLLDQGYVADADISLTWSAFTITPAGLRWLQTSLPEPLLTDHRVQELAESAGQEDAFESALRAELEEERRRIEDLERDLTEDRPVAPGTATEGPEGVVETRSTAEGPQETTEGRWWEFWR